MAARAGAAKERPKTRTRIAAACRRLFNERGPGDVTTAEIAEAVGINEGNLYYHFQRKEQIVEALFAEYEHAFREVAAAYQPGTQDPRHYRDYFAGWFNLMWEWRFFYRDGAVVDRLAPRLRRHLKAMADDGQGQVRRVYEGMVVAELMRATPVEIDTLVINGWIIATYWIDYLRSRHAIATIRREHIDWGAQQALGLVAPYLTPAGRLVVEIAGTAPSDAKLPNFGVDAPTGRRSGRS
jgi:AcrR family transcriptional regulator